MMRAKRSTAHDRDAGSSRRIPVTNPHVNRRYPIGAELIGPNETHFRLWAPKAQHVDLVLEESAKTMRSAAFIRSTPKAAVIFQASPRSVPGRFIASG